MTSAPTGSALLALAITSPTAPPGIASPTGTEPWMLLELARTVSHTDRPRANGFYRRAIELDTSCLIALRNLAVLALPGDAALRVLSGGRHLTLRGSDLDAYSASRGAREARWFARMSPPAPGMFCTIIVGAPGRCFGM